MADGDTVADKIAAIAASKAAIAQAISAKGVTVPEGAKLADLAPLVGQISGGGGGAADTCALDRDTMTELVIPEGTTRIGSSAFSGCNALASLTLPNGLTTIGDSAFYRCEALTSLTLPEGLTTIGTYAFNGCNALTSLTLPNGVTSIGSYAFYGCPSTCNITFAKTTTEVSAMDNYPWGISSGAVIHCTDGDLTV